MFVFLRDVTAAKQVIATLLATALVLWASGAFNIVQAANITDVKDTLSDSAPSASSTHSIEFVSPTGIAGGETITVTFPAGFTGTSSVVAADITLAEDGVAETVVDGAPGAGQWGLSWSLNTLTLTADAGAAIAANASTTIEIGSTAGNQIVNPTPAGGNQSYEIDISAGTSDSGHTRVVILDTVLVTATVDTVFDFTVAGTAAATAVSGTSTTLLSTSTTIPFGTLEAWSPELIAQDLSVDTNAANGFVVTVHKDGAFQSSTGADIDDFAQGVFSDTPAAWEAPDNTIDQEDTYGHWGVTSNDQQTNGVRDSGDFSDNNYVSIGTSTSPTVVFAHNGPATSDFAQGTTTVGYKVQISPLQEAGDDYQAVLTYIATPTF